LGVNFGLWAIAVIPTYFVVHTVGTGKGLENTERAESDETDSTK
jgi:hypothetical protein